VRPEAETLGCHYLLPSCPTAASRLQLSRWRLCRRQGPSGIDRSRL